MEREEKIKLILDRLDREEASFPMQVAGYCLDKAIQEPDEKKQIRFFIGAKEHLKQVEGGEEVEKLERMVNSKYQSRLGYFYSKIGNYGKAEHAYKKAIQLGEAGGESRENLDKLEGELALNKAKGQIIEGIMAEVRRGEEGRNEELRKFGRAKSVIKKALSRTSEKKLELRSMLSLIDMLEYFMKSLLEHDRAYLGEVVERADGASEFLLSPYPVKEMFRSIEIKEYKQVKRKVKEIFTKATEEGRKLLDFDGNMFKIQMDDFFIPIQREIFLRKGFKRLDDLSGDVTNQFDYSIEKMEEDAREKAMDAKIRQEQRTEREVESVIRDLGELL